MQELEKKYIKIKRALFDKAYGDLNDMQRKAVFTTEGPLLVLAGAGSGKTTVLVRRIVYIIKYGNAYADESVPFGLTEEKVAYYESMLYRPVGDIEAVLSDFRCAACPPYRVMAITFTNKAANEIKERLAAALDDPASASQICAGTFHSVCLRMLRFNADKVGLAEGFTVYDETDRKKAVQAAMKELDIDEKMLPLKTVMNRISRAKEKLKPAGAFYAEQSEYREKQIGEIYVKYSELLQKSNAVDFDDIIMKTVFLLQGDAEVRQKYANLYRYISVDEFQDTNEAQLALVLLLSSAHRNIMVVGDDDQSIYRFRGATIENILGFDKNFTDAKVVKLEQNYRSTQNILNAANEVISNNEGRHQKTLWTDNQEGEKIHEVEVADQNAEARFIVETIDRYVSRGKKTYRDFAVLYRTNAQANTIETVFSKSAMPYRVIGGTRFSDRKEIRDIVAYLQLINNHSDRERLLRIINEPKRKIGDRTLEGIEQIANEQGTTMFNVIENADKYAALSRSATTLLSFAALINSLTALSDTLPLEDFVREVIERSGYKNMLIEGGAAEKDRLDNLEEFVSGVIEYKSRTEEPTLTGFLEETALVADVDRYDENADACVLMTVHSAKGLEFPIVFLAGMEDGLFPGMASILDPQEMEEERRLAYVAITRAKSEIYIIHAKNRLLYGRTSINPPSTFLREIPDRLIDKKSDARISSPRETAKVYFSSSESSKMPFGTLIKPSFVEQKKPTSIERFAPGDLVEHTSFGRGEVISVKEMGSDTLYEIIFEKVGTKKLMATYARLKRAK